MREFFVQNETIILFAQGLVFFSLGFAVWLQRRRATRLTLSSSLIWLASFAFVEAFAVWGYAFVPIQEGYLSEGLVEGLMVLRGIVQVAAFLFLVQFGLRLLGLSAVVRRSLTGLSILAGAGIVAGCALAADAAGWSAAEWEAAVVSLVALHAPVPGGHALGDRSLAPAQRAGRRGDDRHPPLRRGGRRRRSRPTPSSAG